jgi:8-oxo-dGTP pyrophosphatase MutT (NUDIX family)
VLPSKVEAACDWFETRLAAAFVNGLNGLGGHGAGADSPVPFHGPLRPAAVLIPMVWHESGPTVLLTRRNLQLPTHAGQVSLPGGKQDRDDADAVATALRETWEEVGLEPQRVRVLGQLARYVTITGFHVSPVVGLIQPPVEWRPNPREVDGVFEVPLELVLDPAAYLAETYERDGRRGQVWVLDYRPERVWGATAAMLRGFALLMQASA